MKVTVVNNQCLADVAVQVYGSAEAVFTLANENNLSVTDLLTAGQQLDFSSENIVNKRVADYYKANNVHPVTGFDGDVDSRLFDETFDNSFN
jgi:hypothetical protein